MPAILSRLRSTAGKRGQVARGTAFRFLCLIALFLSLHAHGESTAGAGSRVSVDPDTAERDRIAGQIRFSAEWERRKLWVRYLQLLLNSKLLLSSFWKGDIAIGRAYDRGLGERPVRELYSLLKKNEPHQDRYVLSEWMETPKGMGFQVKYKHAGAGLERSDFYFNVLTDPGVVETTMSSPLTQAEFERVEPFLNQDIFEPADSLGIRRSRTGGVHGADHLNMDSRTAFENVALRARNFLVDFNNHSELASGVLGELDEFNARPLTAGRPGNPLRRAFLNHIFSRYLKVPTARFFEEKKESFKKMILNFDARWVKGEKLAVDRDVLAVYNRDVLLSEGHHDALAARDPETKRERLEIRSIRPQSTRGYRLLTKLFAARVAYLSQIPYPIDFEDKAPVTGTREGAEAFYRYVSECGLDWKEYLEILPKRYHRAYIAAAEAAKSGPAVSAFPRELPELWKRRFQELMRKKSWETVKAEISLLPWSLKSDAKRLALSLLPEPLLLDEKDRLFWTEPRKREFISLSRFLAKEDPPAVSLPEKSTASTASTPSATRRCDYDAMTEETGQETQ